MPHHQQAINPQVFDHLVSLAALELVPQEAEYLRRELNNQLTAIQELEAIQLPDDLPLAAHGLPYPPDCRQALRPDRHAPFGDSQAIVRLAAQVEENCVVVPDIPHITLG